MNKVAKIILAVYIVTIIYLGIAYAATEQKQTILMVTHDAHAASYADRVVFLKDGMIAGEMLNPTHDAVLQAMGQLEGK